MGTAVPGHRPNHMIHNVTAQVGANPITIETGKLAKLADGAVTLRIGDTIVLVTAVSATTIKEGQDWFPLTVDYREKAAAVGKFPGGYFKREGRPSEKEILTCRMTDRPLRPLFPKGYLYDTQIISVLLSADGVHDPDILVINGASAALMVSDVPFAGPVGAVRVGRIGGEFVANPTHEQMAQSDLDLVYAGIKDAVIMIEGSALELPEDDFVAALAFAQIEAGKMIDAQNELAALVGKTKRQMPLFTVKDELLEVAYSVAGDRIEAALYTSGKVNRMKAVDALKTEVSDAIVERYPNATKFEISQAFDYLQKKAFRVSILDKSIRCDGRPLDQIRALSAEVGVLPRSHGSAIFQRGETQALALATLAPSDEAQDLDGYTGGVTSKRFLLHYNFPPFSVGETGRTGSPGRREIGHGALAERSILPIIPSVQDFPYAIRVSSEVMESNGSTSMASVCSGVLALMDAGVPIKKPVAGISCGLVTEFRADGTMERYSMLTDIIGSEDHFGDMDFKLCGTDTGVTGFQLDLKLAGIPLHLMNEAVYRTRDARYKILEVMLQALGAPRTELSQYAPRIETLKINPEKIGMLIGPGGKNIKAIVAETGCEINVEDDGTVHIYSVNPDGMVRARQIIAGMFAEIEIGALYQGSVVSLKDFGAFVEVMPGKDGLCHISELADFRVQYTSDVVKEGDLVWVKCIGVDEKGRVKLSRKAAMAERGEAALATDGSDPRTKDGYKEQQRDDRGPRGDDRGPRRDDRGPRRDDRGPRRDDRGPREGGGPRFEDRPPRFEDGPAPQQDRPAQQENRGPSPEGAPTQNQ
jgi:polyribonucleotide nucleotidyltransferase